MSNQGQQIEPSVTELKFLNKKPMRATKGTLAKRKLRLEADKLWKEAVIKRWGDKCILCPKPADIHQTHHFKPKSHYASLRYDIENGCPICRKCHFTLEHVDKSLVAEIATIRGKEWYQGIQLKAQQTHSGLTTISWYRQQIERLKEYLN